MSRTKERNRPGTLENGVRLSEGLTVLQAIDPGSQEPVYLVWDHVGWCVLACKVMSGHERAVREGELLNSMAHPSIVRLMEVRKPGLLLMPFLEGPRLSDLLDKARGKRLAISDALRVAIHIGGALAHIHAKGLIHLDIKPDNIIIAAGGRPVLFDFGTARRLDEPRPATPSGTDPYIAPEECLLENAGTPADVFSLGVMLYEMLLGRLPFGKGSAAAPFPQLRRSVRPMRAVRRAIPAELEETILACLSKRADLRPGLPELLVTLNRNIERGPKMWPAGFDPSVSRGQREVPSVSSSAEDDDTSGRRQKASRSSKAASFAPGL